MNPKTVRRALVAAALCAACASSTYNPEMHGVDNMWAGRQLHRQSADLAIIRQAAVFEHHFVVGSAELTQLGQRDLDVLAKHHLAHPGRIAVRRGSADEALYEARIDLVVLELASAGIDVSRLEVGPGLVGGEGFGSGDVRLALESERQSTQSTSGPLAVGNGDQGGQR